MLCKYQFFFLHIIYHEIVFLKCPDKMMTILFMVIYSIVFPCVGIGIVNKFNSNTWYWKYWSNLESVQS